MNKLRKLLVFILAFAMCFQTVVPALAANDYGVTYNATLDKSEITVSDEAQTVVMTVKASKKVDLDSITAQVHTPDGLTLTNIQNSELGFGGGNINKNNGKISWSYDYADADYLTTDIIAVVTFTVPANTPAGSYVIPFDIINMTNDWGTTWEDGATVSATLKIEDAEPEDPVCDHEGKEHKYESNGNGTHKVTCNECGGTVALKEDCTGGTATCEAKAKCSKCKATYGDLGSHDYGTKVPAKDAIHTKDELKGAVAAHYKCSVCEKYFDADKNETTLKALTGEAPEHTWNDGEVTKAPDCDDKGVKTFTCTFDGCGATYTEDIAAAGHKYGELIEATEAVHTKDELAPAVAAHYFCDVCDTYFTEEKVATTLEKLKGETPEHTVDPGKTQENITKDPTCTEEGTKDVTTFCSCGYSFGTQKDVAIPADGVTHSWTVTYSWSGDSCTAERSCEAEGCQVPAQTETVTGTKSVTTPGTCTVKEVYVYEATFKATWATPQTSDPITGDYKHTGNCAECGVAKLNDKYYPTLQAAVDAAIGGDKVYLLKDTQENVTIPVQCNVDIYLDGHTLEAKGDGVPLTVNGANVYIKTGGTITAANNAAIAVVDTNGYVLIEDPMTVTRTGEGKLFTLDGIGAICINSPGGKYSQDPTACGAELREGLIVAEKNGYFTIVQCEHENATYSNKTDTTHDWKCDCGSSGTNVEHFYDETTHQCVCGVKEKFAYTIETYEMDTAGQYVLKNTETKTADFGTEIDLTGVEVPEHFYLDGENIGSNLGGTVTADETLVLKVFLAREKYKVKIIWNGEKWFEEEHYYDTTVILGTQKIPEGYTFGGYSEVEYGPAVTTGEGKNEYTVTKDVTLYAIVKPNLYRLSLNNNIPWDLAQQNFSVPVGRTFATEADFIEWIGGTRDPEGYHFVNFTYEDGKALEFPFQYPAKNLTIVANYEANMYTLKINVCATGAKIGIEVPYGAYVLDALAEYEGHQIPSIGEKFLVENDEFDGVRTVCGYYYDDGEWGDWVTETLKMPANDLAVDQVYTFNGWEIRDIGSSYWLESDDFSGYLTGWNYIEEDYDDVAGGAWYYFEESTHEDWGGNFVRAEGLTRVPYPTEKINGKTYAPNEADKAYWEANKDTSKYTDAETAVFVFGTDGKFQQTTGIVDGKHYAKDGMIGWHHGLVEVDGEYYYFGGDKSDEKLGNIAANGDTYVTRLNGIKGFDYNGVYNFKDGKLSGLNGIHNLKYYENSKLMRGNGLTKVGDKYIYVRTSGQLATGDYWVTKNNGYCESGMYNFGTDGYMVIEQDLAVEGIVNGVYYKNGKPYYAGLIEIDGDMYYIRSNGQVATGEYYVTKVNDTGIAKGTKLVFGEDGKMVPIKNGIVAEEKGLFYYENNKLMKGAGVVKLTDEEGEIFYIYVRSNGQLATGIYWPTTRNGYLKSGPYNWGDNGRYYPA